MHKHYRLSSSVAIVSQVSFDLYAPYKVNVNNVVAQMHNILWE